jgi:hypothetical protein
MQRDRCLQFWEIENAFHRDDAERLGELLIPR